MSLCMRYHLFINLLVFLIGTAYLQARFYQPDCSLWGEYYVDYVIINNETEKITLELEDGGTLIIPFDFGFKELQITTGRGFEQNYVYDGEKLIQTKHRECAGSI